MNKYDTLENIWHKFSCPTTSYLIVQDRKGRKEYIDGFRPEDPDGGCMATGTSSAVYGHSENEEYWFHSPKNKEAGKSEWAFIESYEENFIFVNTAQVHYFVA